MKLKAPKFHPSLFDVAYTDQSTVYPQNIIDAHEAHMAYLKARRARMRKAARIAAEEIPTVYQVKLWWLDGSSEYHEVEAWDINEAEALAKQKMHGNCFAHIINTDNGYWIETSHFVD